MICLVHCWIALPQMTGTREMKDTINSFSTNDTETMSEVEVKSPKTSPACAQIKLYGIEPKKVDQKNGDTGMSSKGDTKLMNQ